MRLLLALLLFGAPPAPLAAQCQLCGQDGKDAAIVARKASMPLRVEVDTQLDLGREIEIDPLTGARRLRGDVRDLGGFAVTGVVTVSGEPGAEVRVTLPPSVDLESGSGASARVTGLATDLGAAPRLGPDGRLVFRFGGRLQVAGATDGDYRGRIPVTVEYP